MTYLNKHISCVNCPNRSHFFDSLSESEILQIQNNKTEITFKKGEIIACQGEPISDFIYLKSGLIKLYIERNNRKSQIISIAKPNDFVSFLNTFAGEEHQYSISALENSVVCKIPIAVIHNIIQSNGGFSLSLIKKISKSSDNIIQSSYDRFNKQLRGKIAMILLDFSENIYLNNEFEIPISRKEFAELLGVSSENVIRVLSEFNKDETIQIYGKKISINRPEMLKKIALVG